MEGENRYQKKEQKGQIERKLKQALKEAFKKFQKKNMSCKKNKMAREEYERIQKGFVSTYYN